LIGGIAAAHTNIRMINDRLSGALPILLCLESGPSST
jgi:hypothetical protein